MPWKNFPKIVGSVKHVKCSFTDANYFSTYQWSQRICLCLWQILLEFCLHICFHANQTKVIESKGKVDLIYVRIDPLDTPNLHVALTLDLHTVFSWLSLEVLPGPFQISTTNPMWNLIICWLFNCLSLLHSPYQLIWNVVFYDCISIFTKIISGSSNVYLLLIFKGGIF